MKQCRFAVLNQEALLPFCCADSWSTAILLCWLMKHCRFAALTQEALPFCCTTRLHEALLYYSDWLSFMKHCCFAVTDSWSTAILLWLAQLHEALPFCCTDSASWSTTVLLCPTQLHEVLQFCCARLSFMKHCSLAATDSGSWSAAV